MSTALTQEVRMAVGYTKQTNLTTPVVVGNMWSLRQTNTDFINATPVNEDDQADLGKGVYTTELFPEFIQSGGAWNGRLTAEAAAMLTCFGIGAAVKSGTFTYTAIAPDFATTGLDLPTTTFVYQIQSPSGAVSDKLMMAMACEEFGFNFKQGPGRDNALFTSSWLGAGGFTKPSGIAIPTIYAENTINAGGITSLSFGGFNYFSNLRFIDFKFGWKNNIRDASSYFPGSGNQSGFQLRGRIRRGTPSITLQTTVECDSGSDEEDLLIAGTPGTGTIIAASATSGCSLEIDFYKIIPKATPLQDVDGIASFTVDWTVLQHPTNGVLQIVSKCLQDGILGL